MTPEEKAQMKSHYTRETRRQMYEKQAEDKLKKEKDRNPQKFQPEKPIEMYTSKGEIRQCNEGRFKFSLQ